MAQLIIPQDFYKTEIRDGFPIGELMKRNWAAQLQVLEDVKEMCAKHDIKWFAFAGTALGAVRHKGFIPWDDDIDICMPGEDFIKFLYHMEEFEGKYIPLSAYSREDWVTRDITRIGNTDKFNFSNENLDRWHNCPFAIGTDIFPLYYIPRDKEKEEYILDLLEKVNALFEINEYNIKLIKEGRIEESKGLTDIISASIIGLQEDTGYEFTSDRTLANQLCILFDQICRFTTKEEADYMARMIPYMRSKKWRFRTDFFDKSVQVPYEMITVPLPKDIDGYCKVLYGDDYLKPRKGGQSHDYPYFGKQLRIVENKIEVLDWAQKHQSSGELTLTIPHNQKLADSKNEKCVVLYYTGVREMMIYGEYVIGKIKDLIEYFKQNQDTLQLWWCPGSFIKEEKDVPPFSRLVPELKEQYENLIREFRESGIGICDESGDIEKALTDCDMYYGDDSFLSELFGKTGKPVYIQDYHTRLLSEDLGCKKIENSGIFEGKVKPMFAEAAYLEDGKGYAFATNMNALFKIDTNNNTCEYLLSVPGEKSNGDFLYTIVKKTEGGLLFIPGSANNAFLFYPKDETIKKYNVYTDTMSQWHDALKFADWVENNGKWYFFGERYTHVLKVDPKTGESVMIGIGRERTEWMRHSAYREGGLVKLVADNSKEMLIFNLRTDGIVVKKEYNSKEVKPKLKENSYKLISLRNKEIELKGDLIKFIDSAFDNYIGEQGMVIKEKEDWVSIEETIEYVKHKKRVNKEV